MIAGGTERGLFEVSRSLGGRVKHLFRVGAVAFWLAGVVWGQAATPESGASTARPDGVAQAGGAADGMEFADDPNFAVAGVTDWTAVGGHGSDAVLRTSEDLARETARLQSRGLEAAGSVGPGDVAEEKRLRAAWVAAPQTYRANQELGEYRLRTGAFAEAVPLLEKAVRVEPGRAEDEYSLARACAGMGELARAEEHVRRAIAEGDAAKFHRLLGDLEERRGESVAAVKEMARATQMEPSEENYLAWGAELLVHRAVWEAEKVFRHGAGVHTGSARLKTAWGAALFAGAKYAEAAEQLCAAADLEPAQAEPYVFLGKMMLVSQEPLPCVAGHLERFVEREPGRVDANYFDGMSLMRGGRTAEVEQGRRLLERAVTIDPTYAAAWLELGVLAARRKDAAEAKQDLERAVAADPQMSEAHYRLGVLYDRAGDVARAKEEFARHDALDREQAAKVEAERKDVKQFQVVSKGDGAPR